MTIVQVMADHDRDEIIVRATEQDEIRKILAPFDVHIEQWDTRELGPTAGQDEVLEAYRPEVDKICAAEGFTVVDVVRMVPDPDNPEWREKADAARTKFLDEHRHGEYEVRFFVEGKGCFYLHLGDRIYAVVCEQGDLISVPAGTTHWFDMGLEPHFCAIRFFEEEDGWVGDFTGSDIARRMPTLDELVA